MDGRRGDGVRRDNVGNLIGRYRCHGGISDNPLESVTREDVAVAVDVLGRFLELVARQHMR